MADPTAICAAAAAQIAARTGITAFGKAPGQVNPPMIIVIPGNPVITYGVTLDGEVNMNLRIVALASAANDDTGQLAVNAYIATSGQLSVPAAMGADPTLGGTVEFAEVTTVTQYGLIDYSGQQYFGATFNCQVGAHL